jgi:hypothetical protein
LVAIWKDKSASASELEKCLFSAWKKIARKQLNSRSGIAALPLQLIAHGTFCELKIIKMDIVG